MQAYPVSIHFLFLKLLQDVSYSYTKCLHYVLIPSGTIQVSDLLEWHFSSTDSNYNFLGYFPCWMLFEIPIDGANFCYPSLSSTHLCSCWYNIILLTRLNMIHSGIPSEYSLFLKKTVTRCIIYPSIIRRACTICWFLWEPFKSLTSLNVHPPSADSKLPFSKLLFLLDVIWNTNRWGRLCYPSSSSTHLYSWLLSRLVWSMQAFVFKTLPNE